MAVFVAGLVGMIAFYILILVVGLVAGRKKNSNINSVEHAILADRNFGYVVGSLTLIATWVGGGAINGTAMIVADPRFGLAGGQAPFCYALSLAVGGLIFGKKMRESKYITMIDPFQERYGKHMGAVLFIPSLIGDLLYNAAVLLALGSTVSVVLGAGLVPSTIASVAVVVVYTLFGGLRSVAYTDLVQLPCIMIGLLLAIPFAVSNPAVSDIIVNSKRWTGEWSETLTARWIDDSIILILGGIPVQAFIQRILAAKTPTTARVGSVLASFGVFLFLILPVLVGAIAANTDWTAAGYLESVNGTNKTTAPIDFGLTLPLVIKFLTPSWVAVISLGAVSAAVMSSVDSSLIGTSSEVANNVYKILIRPKASEGEVVWVMRVTVVIAATVSTAVALAVNSIYGLLYLLGDLAGLFLFPQSFCAVFLTNANTYGSLLAIVVALVLRIGGGDYLLELSPFIKYPYYSDIYGQLFPYKTLAMVCSFATIVIVSYLTKFLFEREILPASMDFLHCFKSYDITKGSEVISMKGKYTEKSENNQSKAKNNEVKENLGYGSAT